MVRRPASCRRLNSIEAHLGQIERLDKHVDQTSLRTAALRQWTLMSLVKRQRAIDRPLAAMLPGGSRR